jgi:tetratricopeptide (TPR) repeat protein
MSLLQSNQQQKAVQFAEKAVANNTASEEVRLVAGDAALNARNYTQAVAAVQPMIDTLPAKAAPEGVSAADWEAKKKSVLGRAYWIAGMAHGNAEKWEDADKAMRGALEVLGGDKDLLPSIYFYIGLANYRLAEGPKGQKARMADARKFMQLCAQLRSPYQGTAQKNLAAMAAGR